MELFPSKVLIIVAIVLCASISLADPIPDWGGATKKVAPRQPLRTPVPPAPPAPTTGTWNTPGRSGATFTPQVWKLAEGGASPKDRQSISVSLGGRKLNLAGQQIWAALDVVDASGQTSVKRAFQGNVVVTRPDSFVANLNRVGRLNKGSYYLDLRLGGTAYRLTKIEVVSTGGAPQTPPPQAPPPFSASMIQDILISPEGSTDVVLTFISRPPGPSVDSEISWHIIGGAIRCVDPSRGSVLISAGSSQAVVVLKRTKNYRCLGIVGVDTRQQYGGGSYFSKHFTLPAIP